MGAVDFGRPTNREKRQQMQSGVQDLSAKGYLSKRSKAALDDAIQIELASPCGSFKGSPVRESLAPGDPFYAVREVPIESVTKRWYEVGLLFPVLPPPPLPLPFPAFASLPLSQSNPISSNPIQSSPIPSTPTTAFQCNSMKSRDL